jgi:hypothetical protein
VRHIPTAYSFPMHEAPSSLKRMLVGGDILRVSSRRLTLAAREYVMYASREDGCSPMQEFVSVHAIQCNAMD